jgi:hypothetical protein
MHAIKIRSSGDIGAILDQQCRAAILHERPQLLGSAADGRIARTRLEAEQGAGNSVGAERVGQQRLETDKRIAPEPRRREIQLDALRVGGCQRSVRRGANSAPGRS